MFYFSIFQERAVYLYHTYIVFGLFFCLSVYMHLAIFPTSPLWCTHISEPSRDTCSLANIIDITWWRRVLNSS